MDNLQENLTPVLKQYLTFKKEHPDKILFFRMGDFYEMFFEDAVTASKILNITLTSRHKESQIPMCGIPYHALANYTQKIVDLGFKIAICEQIGDPKLSKGVVERAVTRVITPSINSEIDNLFSTENYFLFVYYHKNLSLVDFTNGDFFYETEVTLYNLIDEIEKYLPKEIFISKDDFTSLKKQINISNYNFSVNFIDEDDSTDYSQDIEEWLSQINEDIPEKIIKVALQYIIENNKFIPKNLKLPQKINLKKFLNINENTLNHLELLPSSNSRDNASLYSLINQTKTPMGSRTLKKWISYPLTDASVLQERYNFIEDFIDKSELRKNLISILNSLGDIERLNSKIALKNILPQNLITLKNYIMKFPDIKETLLKSDSQLAHTLSSKIEYLREVVDIIEKYILPDPSNNLNEGNYINKGINHELDELREVRLNTKKWLLNYENEIKSLHNIPIKIKYNKVFGYFIEITKRNTDNIPSDFIRKQTLVNAERYITEQLKDFEEKILSADEKIEKIEKEIYFDLVSQLQTFCKRIKSASEIIAEIDILISFTEVSLKNNYSKPEITDSNQLQIIDGKHPILSQILKENFIPNNLTMDSDNNIFIITGPNMAGKSTYMRQCALIIIMAQMGCFVPASKMIYPIFNRIFSRIGARDKIIEGESTFMVEMNETSYILNNITDNSFIILDELGRGTSTYDGMSIAWAILEFLANINKKIFTLFATHYHELTSLESDFPNISNFSVNVMEINDRLLFLRQIVKGPADKSYGIEVAHLAKLPEKVITRAKEILNKLENRETPKIKSKFRQVSIFEALQRNTTDKIIEEIKNFDIENSTPLNALNFIDRVKNKLNSTTD